MNCPICNFSEVSEAATNCPACQSDLEIFAHLADARKQHLFQKRSVAVLAVLLVIAAVGWGATQFFDVAKNKNLQADTTAGNATIAWLIKEKENDRLKAEITSFKNEIKTLNEVLSVAKKSSSEGTHLSTASGTITHLVKEGESLWKIAEKYYKDGWQYKRISDDNGITDPQNIRAGMELKINN
ncbi:MAG: LysM domain-containing protein [Bacteroidota bacterium]